MKIGTSVLMAVSDGSDGSGGSGGSGGESADWRSTLDSSIRDDPSLKNISDIPTLAKSYVHAQKLVGQDKIPAPRADWKDQDWATLWNRLGRPEAPNGYKKPENLKLEEGIKLDDAKLSKAFEQFHKMGLSGKQADQMIEFYAGVLNEGVKGDRDQQAQKMDQAISELRTKYGDKFDARVDLARSVIDKFGGDNDELIKYFDERGLSNDPKLISLLSSIGEAMMEDRARDGTGQSLFVRDGTQAMAEIESLVMDTEFQQALNSREHPGHNVALEKWERLHKLAYPGKITG
jgi:hypothetical protein